LLFFLGAAVGFLLRVLLSSLLTGKVKAPSMLLVDGLVSSPTVLEAPAVSGDGLLAEVVEVDIFWEWAKMLS